MENVFYSSDRAFRLCDYTMGLSQLLLRAPKDSIYKTNIDIAFFDASFIQLFYRLEGVKISSINKDGYKGYGSVSKYLDYPTHHLFQLESKGELYYIAGAFVKIYENDLDFNITSLSMDEPDKGILLATSF